MHVQTLTLSVPDSLYTRLQQRAQEANRSVTAEIMDVLATAVPTNEVLPPDLAEALPPLALLDDEALRRAAWSRLPEDAVGQLESLHLKRQREGLIESETETLAGLMRQYERAMLVRAHAAAILRQRGHDVADFLVPQ